MQITNFKMALPHESHVAEFSIYIPQWHVTFHRFKIRKSKKETLFVSSPSFSEEMLNGEKKWCSFIEFSKEKKGEFDKKVMELVRPMLDKKPETVGTYTMDDVPF